MQCVEGTESEAGEHAGALVDISGRFDRAVGPPQPEVSRETAVFAWIPVILKAMSRRDSEMNAAVLHPFEDSRHRFSLAPDSLARRIVEWPLESANVEIDDCPAHRIIVIRRSAELRSPLREAATCLPC